MSDRSNTEREIRAPEGVASRQDMEEEHLPHFIGEGVDDDEDDPFRLEAHQRLHPHDRAHVSLTQDEYTAEEVARLLGTTTDNIIHAIRAGELKAQRAGRDIVCIQRVDLVDWLNRGGGV